MTTMTTQPNNVPKVVLHWLDDSRAQRIAWLFEELGIEYEIQVYHRLPNKLAPPELKAIHPLGRSPVVTIPSESLTLAESGFITQYFTTRLQKLQPNPTSPPYHKFTYLLHFAEGTLMPPLTIAYILEQVRNAENVPFFIKPITNRIVGGIYDVFLTKTIHDNFGYLEGLLAEGGGKKWFVEGDGEEGKEGVFSGVDVLLSYPLFAAKREGVKGFEKERYPRLWEWLERVQARDAFKRADERTYRYEQNGGSRQ